MKYWKINYQWGPYLINLTWNQNTQPVLLKKLVSCNAIVLAKNSCFGQQNLLRALKNAQTISKGFCTYWWWDSKILFYLRNMLTANLNWQPPDHISSKLCNPAFKRDQSCRQWIHCASKVFATRTEGSRGSVLIETVVHLECKRLDGKGCSLLGRHDTWGALGDVSGPVHQGIRPHPLQPCTYFHQGHSSVSRSIWIKMAVGD